MSNKIVITGASGFLGRHLLERLKNDEEYQVFAFSSHPEDLREKITGTNITYCHKDCLFDDSMKQTLRDSTVINCAYPRNSSGPEIAKGLEYCRDVFMAAVESDATAIVNISSQSVYSSKREEAATEETPVCLESQYAIGKYAMELLLESVCAFGTTCFTNIRLASLIGPGFDQRIINRLVKQAVVRGTIEINRNHQIFGFFDVQDAVSGIVAMLSSEKDTWKKVYNLGGASGCSLEDIGETIKQVIHDSEHKDITVLYHDGDEIGSTVIDSHLFYNEFGFNPNRLMTLYESTSRILNMIQAESDY